MLRNGDPKLDDMCALAGETIRVTWPNGARKSGLVDLWPPGDPSYGRLAGHGMIGGEFCTIVRLERKGANGRFVTVKEYGS